MQTLTIPMADDCHLHVRDGYLLSIVMPHVLSQFARAIIMPNLTPPVTTVQQAMSYRQRILAALPVNTDFKPLMALYLTEQTTLGLIQAAAEEPHIIGFKLYPQGVTTHSEQGVHDITKIYPLLAAMMQHDVPLLIHGESHAPEVDIFDREQVFIDEVLSVLVQHFPSLRMVLEHVSTAYGVEFIKQAPKHVAGTITPHHLCLNRNHVVSSKIKPHHFCLPIPKRKEDQNVLIQAATSGNPKFFLGTDSAPHLKSQKESAEGCAGIYVSHAALALYADVFHKQGCLEHLADFASLFGAQFYGLTPNTQTVTLAQQEHIVPEHYGTSAQPLIPLYAGQIIPWSILETL